MAALKRNPRRWSAAAVALLLAAALCGCAAPPVGGPAPAFEQAPADDSTLIVVAVEDTPEAMPGAGATPRSAYAGGAGYAGSTRAAALSAALAREHGLHEQAFWSIAPLKLRCMLFRIAAGSERAAVLAQLGRDPRVRLAQPLNSFDTLALPAVPAVPAVPAIAAGERYNDPYVGLQRGFAAIDAAQAQRWSRGDGVRVALIDSGVDGSHPDLEGRIASQRDFVAGDRSPAAGGERHGTEVAGVIAAAANNRIGIVGVAPQARLLAYRACWPVAGGGSRCDTFTLAQALGAAIAADADIINLSLGGPADPLLQRLAEYAIKRGTIVVGALPPGGRVDGFPAGVAGVLVVGSSDETGLARSVLSAPGRDILTLAPGGHYGYASGSSLAAAHVSGAVALLRALSPGLRAETVQALLERAPQPANTNTNTNTPVDVCSAVRRLRAAAACGQREPAAP